MTTAPERRRVEQESGQVAQLETIEPCAPHTPLWHPWPPNSPSTACPEREAAVDHTSGNDLLCDAVLEVGPEGVIVIAAETDDPPSADSWRCEKPAEFQVIFGPTTNDEGGTGVRLRCLDCAESAVQAFGLGTVRLIGL